MLKKIHKCQSGQESLHCSLCRKNSCKANLYMCNSGHITCENCQNMAVTQECGDNAQCIPEKDCYSDKNCTLLSKDLASGDFNETYNQSRAKQRPQKKISFSEIKEEPRNEIHEKLDFETTVKYKNPNYKDSSGSSIHSHLNVLSRAIPPRPIVCPDARCSKMVAIDSVLLHFYFDHSKIPRLALEKGVSQKMALNAANLTTETQCIGIFTIKPIISEDSHSTSLLTDQNPLLLLTVRMPPEVFQKQAFKSESVILRNTYTQTDPHNQNLENQKKPIVTNLVSNKGITGEKGNQFSDYEHLMIWLCKLDDTDHVYSVTLTKEDNKLSFNYTGATSHIRNKQDAISVNKRFDCLMIRGIAANKLLNNNNQIDVLIKLV